MDKNIHFKKTFSYFWPAIKPNIRLVILDWVFHIFGMVTSYVITPLYFQKIVDNISTNTKTPEEIKALVYLIIVLFIVRIFRTIFSASAFYFMSRCLSDIQQRLSLDAFNRISKHSYKFFADNFSGSLIAKTRRYNRAFQTIYEAITGRLTFFVVVLVGTITTLGVFDIRLAGVFVVWAIIFLALSFRFAKNKVPINKTKAAADTKVTATLSDIIINILNVKIFSSSERELDRYRKITDIERVSTYEFWKYNAYTDFRQGMVVSLLFLFGIGYAVLLWYKGDITIGVVVLVITYVQTLARSIWDVANSYNYLIEAISDTNEIIELFETEIDIKDPEYPEMINVTDGSIEFVNVDFRYKDGQNVFNDLNLKIKGKSKVGLVGYSGGGKTTVTNLLLRFVDIDSGDILIDGKSIYKTTQDDLRKLISYVPQDPQLFHRSLYENISYGKADADMEDVIRAAKLAKIHDFIMTLPQGYETTVGERGIKLSGGQRQRVAIARAILENAPIFILDEATSSLDSETEKDIQDALEEVMKDRTSIVIAHRLSTIKSMDRIIVLEDGKIMEDGSHTELLRNKDVYHKLWQHQSHGI